VGKRIGKRLGGETNQPKEKKKSRLTGFQKFLLVICILLALALAAVFAWKKTFVRPELPDKSQTTVTNPETGEVEEEVIDYGDGIRPKVDGKRKSQDFYTILVLGRDTGGGGNTDTMLLASYDVTNQKATVMSIPRDTMVNVNWDVKKINSVYNMNGAGSKGLKALYKEISQLVGFEPDYEVIVEWEAVGQIVDAIGGVYFDVPYTMDYHDPYQDLVIEQAAGYRLLTGDDAMQVIRWRKNDPWSKHGYTKGIGDDGRMQVQQDFLKAVIKQLLTPANIKNIGKIATVFQQSVETDLSFQEILWFGQQAVSGGLGVEDVEFLTMPMYNASAFSRSYSKEFGKPYYLAYVVPYRDKLLTLVNEKLSPFEEPFKMSDLDLMYVNKDGSIGSTTGYVEDTPAASPPDLSPWGQGEPETEYETDENGNLIDPETGEVIPVDPETGEPITGDTPGGGTTITIDPITGEPLPGVTIPETETPGETDTPDAPPATQPETDPETTAPVTPAPQNPAPVAPADPEPEPPAETVPVEPVEPEEPVESFDPGFILIGAE